MAQTIKLKRGTTTPTTSNIVSGEVAIDTSAQKLYINDAGTIKEIGGGGGGGTLDSVTDSGATTTNKITIGGLVVDGEIEEQTYSLTGTAIDPANGTIQYKTLSANTTFTESLAEGEYVTLLIDDGSGYTITWPTVYWPNGIAPTLATTGWNVIQLWKANSLLFGSFVSA